MSIEGQFGVSVVIPTFNRADAVLEAIDSALTQDWEPLELVVVDDASTDDTVARLTRLAQTEPRLRVIARNVNGGAAAARNDGVLAASYRYVALLDSDNMFMPGKLATQMPSLLDGPDSAVSFSAYLLVVDGCRTPIVLDDWSAERDAVIEALLERCCVNTSTFVAQRAALLDAGLFRSEMEPCEDHDIWLRLAMLNHEFLYEPALLTTYRMDASSISADSSRVAIQSQRVIHTFLRRADISDRIKRRRRFYKGRWALSASGRFLTAGDGRRAIWSLGQALFLSPRSARPGWALLALRAAAMQLSAALQRLGRRGPSPR